MIPYIQSDIKSSIRLDILARIRQLADLLLYNIIYGDDLSETQNNYTITDINKPYNLCYLIY